jgi:GNAT superfamily N-acetyltransferase
MFGAVVARLEEDGRRVIIGGDRYIVVELAKPQVAFFVVNQYQGQWAGAALMHHLAAIARDARTQAING